MIDNKSNFLTTVRYDINSCLQNDTCAVPVRLRAFSNSVLPACASQRVKSALFWFDESFSPRTTRRTVRVPVALTSKSAVYSLLPVIPLSTRLFVVR